MQNLSLLAICCRYFLGSKTYFQPNSKWYFLSCKGYSTPVAIRAVDHARLPHSSSKGSPRNATHPCRMGQTLNPYCWGAYLRGYLWQLQWAVQHLNPRYSEINLRPGFFEQFRTRMPRTRPDLYGYTTSTYGLPMEIHCGTSWAKLVKIGTLILNQLKKKPLLPDPKGVR